MFKRKRFKTLCKIFKAYSEKPELENADWDEFENTIIVDDERKKSAKKIKQWYQS
jgi:hypothetical protein